MPIYEYRCTACSAELEKLRKISDPPFVQCPECGRDTLVKLVSASSFRLNGWGWYETDFKTGKKKNGVGDADASGAKVAPDSAKTAGGAQASADGGKDSAAANKGAATESKSSGTSASAPKE
jgi:putative FmdB family regulatory protein